MNKVCRVDSSAFEDQIAAQLVAVVVRVPPVQQPAVQMLLPLLAAGIAINGCVRLPMQFCADWWYFSCS